MDTSVGVCLCVCVCVCVSEGGGAVSKCRPNTKAKLATPVSCTKLFSLKRAVVVLRARGGAEEAEGVARQRARLA